MKWTILSILVFCSMLRGQDSPAVSVEELPLLEEQKLIVSGLALSPDGQKVALSTVRGRIWILDKPLRAPERYSDLRWQLFAEGLHRPSALRWDAEGLTVGEESGFTRLRDRDGDGKADEYLAAEAFAGGSALGPFRGVNWIDPPIAQGVFQGQFLGTGRNEAHLSRLSIVSDQRGTHFGMVVFLDRLKYPSDALLNLSPSSWLLAASNRHDPTRKRTRFSLHLVRLSEAVQPFEIHSIVAVENGFQLRFTRPLLAESATSIWAYAVECLSDSAPLPLRQAILSDRQTVTLITTSPPEAGKFYHLACRGAWSAERDPVGHPTALFWFGGQEARHAALE